MDNGNITDLILEEEIEIKTSKKKKILFLSAIGILIFLIVIITMKALSYSDNPSQQSIRELQMPDEELNNELSENNIQNQEKIKPEDDIFAKEEQNYRPNISHIDKETSQSIKEVMQRNTQQEYIIEPIDNEPINNEKEEPKKEVKVVKQIIKEPKKEVKTKIIKPKKEVKKEPKKQVKIVKKEKPKSVKELFKNTNISKDGKYFIQVDALTSSKPNKSYLNNLTKNGFNYKVLDEKARGRKYIKVLVGPYSTYNEAKASLSSVRKKINKDAFVYKIK